MIDEKQFKECIIIPTLQHLDPIIPYSTAAVELLLGTAIVESGLTYLRQLGRGPALGVYQMEPATYNDIWRNYLRYNKTLADLVRTLDSYEAPPLSHALTGNLFYATAMARVHYLRVKEAIPNELEYNEEHSYIFALAQYWKDHYNTHLGAGTVEKFVEAWEGCDCG